MADIQIRDRLAQVDAARLQADLHHLACNPLPCRRVNLTLPGHAQSTLDEADDFICARLESLGYSVEREPVPVQAFRCEMSKKKSTWYARPRPNDPWYTAYNLYAELPGGSQPDEIILLCAHKDSQSWVGSPGAYDNGVGTVALLEIARCLSGYRPNRTIRLLWCNEEHGPWTSVTAANRCAERGDNLVAVINVDSLGGRSPEAVAAGRCTNVTLYTEDEGLPLAELVSEVNASYAIGLEQSVIKRQQPGDDDGSFIKAGFPRTIMNLGSFPYSHAFYHDERDVPHDVDYLNVMMGVQVTLGTLLRVDRDGAPG